MKPQPTPKFALAFMRAVYDAADAEEAAVEAAVKAAGRKRMDPRVRPMIRRRVKLLHEILWTGDGSDGTNCRTYRDALCKRFGITLKTLKRDIDWAKDQGWLRQTRRGGGGVEDWAYYDCAIPKWVAVGQVVETEIIHGTQPKLGDTGPRAHDPQWMAESWGTRLRVGTAKLGDTGPRAHDPVPTLPTQGPAVETLSTGRDVGTARGREPTHIDDKPADDETPPWNTSPTPEYVAARQRRSRRPPHPTEDGTER